MTNNPALTISLLSQLTDRELQSNYLNHLDRTPEIASLLAQITDRDLVLRIINLAFEVDLSLGASLTASIASEPQQIIVSQINKLEVSLRLKIALWHQTKSKAALPHLQKIFALKYPYQDDWGRGSEGNTQTIDLTIRAILNIDRDLAIELLISALYDSRIYRDGAIEILIELAPIEAINALGDVPEIMECEYDQTSYDLAHDSIIALGRIGTQTAVDKIRETLHLDRSCWSNTLWIQGLGIVGEPEMVEHLIHLLHFTEDRQVYIETIAALEHIGGDFAFEILHRTLCWILDDDEYQNPFEKIVESLFRLDRERILTAIEYMIHCDDPSIRQRAAKALCNDDILIDDRNLAILLN